MRGATTSSNTQRLSTPTISMKPFSCGPSGTRLTSHYYLYQKLSARPTAGPLSSNISCVSKPSFQSKHASRKLNVAHFETTLSCFFPCSSSACLYDISWSKIRLDGLCQTRKNTITIKAKNIATPRKSATCCSATSSILTSATPRNVSIISNARTKNPNGDVIERMVSVRLSCCSLIGRYSCMANSVRTALSFATRST